MERADVDEEGHLGLARDELLLAAANQSIAGGVRQCSLEEPERTNPWRAALPQGRFHLK